MAKKSAEEIAAEAEEDFSDIESEAEVEVEEEDLGLDDVEAKVEEEAKVAAPSHKQQIEKIRESQKAAAQKKEAEAPPTPVRRGRKPAAASVPLEKKPLSKSFVQGVKDQLLQIEQVLEQANDPKLSNAQKHLVQAITWLDASIKFS